jgi:O-methyltransferase
MLRLPGFTVPERVARLIRTVAHDHVGVWQLSAICELLAQVGDVAGQVVDLGCGDGQWSAAIQRMLDHFEIPKEVVCYDPFPVEPISSLNCIRSEVRCDHEAGINKVDENFRALGLDPPGLVPGWYQDTLEKTLPEEIAFVHMSVAQRQDISCCLNAVYPRMPEGAILVAEGYGLGLSRCVQPAMDSFLTNKPEKIELTVSGIQGAFRRQNPKKWKIAEHAE